jgi:RNA polymerase sigma-70 factor (ECF subfamily)
MPDPAPLVAAFARGAGRDAPPSVDEALGRALEAARVATPGVEAPAEEFARAIGAAVADDEDDLVAAIDKLQTDDLWLATAAAEGDSAAVAAIDDKLASLRPTLARMGATRSTIDELLQNIRVRLLAGTEDRPPRIRSFRGRGDLRSWLKVVAVRDAVRALRSERDTGSAPDELDTLMDPSGDPELEAMRETYREAFRAAFAHALSQLSPRDRNVLRYHLVEGLTIDDLGALYRVHRATAARWLVRIREGLFTSTRAELMQRLRVSDHEIDSVIRMIRSRLDASIVGHLGPDSTA